MHNVINDYIEVKPGAVDSVINDSEVKPGVVQCH